MVYQNINALISFYCDLIIVKCLSFPINLNIDIVSQYIILFELLISKCLQLILICISSDMPKQLLIKPINLLKWPTANFLKKTLISFLLILILGITFVSIIRILIVQSLKKEKWSVEWPENKLKSTESPQTLFWFLPSTEPYKHVIKFLETKLPSRS